MPQAAMPPEAARAAAQRIMARCAALAEISETPGALTRVYLSPEHLRANQCVGAWMEAAGMRVWQDSVGNLCGRYEAATPGAPALLLGSHLDTVRDAGRYDGMLGVLAAIEVVGELHRTGRRLPVALEVMGFADEEGTRFGVTLLGSRGLTGTWPTAWLSRTDAHGTSVARALQEAGLDAARIGAAARPAADILAYLELHIEQGPCLEAAGLPLGVVTAINGARRLNCHFVGEANHAGTVPMGQRRDALAAAAEWTLAVERLATAAGQHLVATVGTLHCLPGAVNVIPGEARLSLDIRGPQDAPLAALLDTLLSEAHAIAARRGLLFTAEQYYAINATACDARLQACLARSVAAVQGESLSLPSGAGHDAIAVAERWPVGMLFVRCDRGISHHPDESVAEADVAAAAAAYFAAALAVATELAPT